MNERLRILKLLEDGKINADEAARLLEAVSNAETKHRRGPHRMWAGIETIPEVIASAVATSFKHAKAKESLEFSKKKKIEFRGISGELKIEGIEQDIVEIEKDGFAKIKERNNTLEIRALSGTINIKTPPTIDLVIKGISGDLQISRLAGMIEIESVSGDIKGEELTGSFIGGFVSGDVDLDYQKIEKVSIRSKTGDILLRLDKKVETEIDLETERGNIECDFALKDEEKTADRLKGTINKAKSKIEIKNIHGDIRIKKRS